MNERQATASRAQRTFPGRPEQVSAARHFVAHALGAGCPVADVVELLVSETVTNAVLHSASGAPGGSVHVSCTVSGRSLRVEVGDQDGGAGPWRRRAEAESLRGRGLLLLDELADRWGVRETAAGRTIWFELEADQPAWTWGTAGARYQASPPPPPLDPPASEPPE
jgi:anti-sigma regulatory factor (Ser/Thr protein kinase)